ncbi:MAG: phosphatidate cytidylyltransferase [Chitinophagales bacterium]|nr:phosphatidate cytidylyltransferase [Chitinophagaceae bacterium]MCB9063885.1 phosphatidate cytidylyltransferase [Chitinophagales bacterium]
MALHWPTFFTRLGSAIVFSAVMMTGLLWSYEYAFITLICLIQVLCLLEFFPLIKKIDPETHQPAWLPIFIQIASLLWLLFQTKVLLGIRFSPILIAIPTFIILATVLSKKNAWRSGMYALGGQMYIMVPMALLYSMYVQSQVIPVALVLMIWMNDTMAYLVGSFIGKTPFSKISPKKTWEGTAGGAILTIAGAAIWGYYSPYYEMIDWMALALCASVAGTAGDLLESKLKRLADIKDSGKLMPGHGGALDRFDSLLVATPFAFTYAYIFMEYIPVTIF